MLKSARLRVVLATVLSCALAFPVAAARAAQPEHEPTDAALSAFANCISSGGAKFYGAHWCGFCQAQKEMFGVAAPSLPYVECFKDGTREKLKKCGILTRFPLWVYGDGSLGRGLQSFVALSRATGCPVP